MEVDNHTQQTIIINTMQTYKMLMLILHTFFFCFIITSSIQYETFNIITPNYSIQSNETLVSPFGTFEAEIFYFVTLKIQKNLCHSLLFQRHLNAVVKKKKKKKIPMARKCRSYMLSQLFIFLHTNTY
jgi:hypothetical protein